MSSGRGKGVGLSDPVSTGDGQGHLVVRNASWLMLSQLLTWSLSTAEAFVVPRRFGPAATGNLHIALSLWAIAALVIGFGTDLTLNRRIAEEQGSGVDDTSVRTTTGAELIGSVLALRVFAHLIGFAVLASFVTVTGYANQVLILVLLFGVSGLASQIANVFDAALYGLQEISVSSRIGMAIRVVETSVVLGLTFAGFSFEQVMAVAIPASIASAGFRFVSLRRRWPFGFRPRLPIALSILREAGPVFLNRLARDLYVQLDVVILSFLATEQVVGFYAVSDVLFGTLLFIPNVVGAAIFPAIARAHADGSENDRELTRRSFHLLLVAIIPVGFGVAAIGDRAIELIYGSGFDEAGTVFRIFGVVIILTALNTVVGQHLMATRREQRLTVLMLAIFVMAVPLDLALISWTIDRYGNGALGAATAYVITEALMFIGGRRLLGAGTLDEATAWLAAKAVAAGLLMLPAVLFLRDRPLAAPIAAGAVTYTLFAFAFRVVPKQDLALARSLLKPSASWRPGQGRTPRR